MIGTESAARAAPDGYTTFLGNIGTLSINPGVYASNMRIKPDQDLAPVTICADTPSILITRLDFPASTVSELIAYVKANQGKVTFATPGSSTLNRLEMEVFKKDAELDMVHVPYKGGAGPAVTDILGGHVDLMFTTISSAMEYVKGNKVKALGVTTRERMADLPDIPTMYELGWKNLVTSSWQGVLVPTGTPRPIVDRLHAAILKVLADPEIQARMRKAGAIAVSSKSPEDFKTYMDAETIKWTKVIEESGVRAE
jgi:tripartite-type tricarboxylate transporter receptor subunit TctC